MPGFDPEVQPIQPDNFINWARPIREPLPDVSGETRGKAIGKAISGFGTAIEEGSEVAYQKQIADSKTMLHSKLDPIVQQQLQELRQLDDVKPGGQSLLDMKPSQLPKEVQQVPGFVDRMTAIRDSGKVSTTYTDAAMDQAAVAVRTKYPGLRDQVDAEYSRYTHQNPANKERQDRIADINAMLAQHNERKNQVRTHLLSAVSAKDGTALPPYVLDMFDKGLIDDNQAMTQVYNNNMIVNKINLDDKMLANKSKSNQLSAEDAAKSNGDMIRNMVAQSMDHFELTVPGLRPGNVNQIMDQIAHGAKIDPVEMQHLASMVKLQKTAIYNNLMALGNRPLDPSDPKSPTRASAQGFEKYSADIAKAMSVYDELLKNFGDEKTIGVGFSLQNRLKTAKEQDELDLRRNFPELGQVAAVAAIEGPKSSIVTEELNHIIQNEQLKGRMRQYVQDILGTAFTQQRTGHADVIQETSAKGISFTLKDAWDDAAQKGVNTPQYSTENQAVLSGIMWAITNPQVVPEIKKNAIESITNPNNHDVLTRVAPSTVNDRGDITPGKSTVLAEMVNPRVTASIKKTGDERQIQNYVDLAKRATGNVISSELMNINRFGIGPYKIGWDDQTKEYSAHVDPKAVVEPGFKDNINNAVTILNLAIRGLVDVHKSLGRGDVDDFLLQFFAENGSEGAFVDALKAAHR